MRNRKLFWLTLLLVGVLGYIHGEHLGGDVRWRTNLVAAKQEATKRGTYLLLNFSSPSCSWCAKMDATTFSSPQIVNLSRRFVCVRLESDTDAVAMAQYRVMEFPTLIVADAQGHPLYKLEGYVPPEKLEPFLKAVLRSSSRGTEKEPIR